MSRQYNSGNDKLISLEGLGSFAEKVKEQMPNISGKAEADDLNALKERVDTLEALLVYLADILEEIA